MILYNTKKPIQFYNYKPLPAGLFRENMNSLEELKENLFSAYENAVIDDMDLLRLAIDTDIRKLDMIITMKQKQLARLEKAGKDNKNE